MGIIVKAFLLRTQYIRGKTRKKAVTTKVSLSWGHLAQLFGLAKSCLNISGLNTLKLLFDFEGFNAIFRIFVFSEEGLLKTCINLQ